AILAAKTESWPLGPRMSLAAPPSTPSETPASPPRWARAADLLCLLVLLLAVVVAEWGGFRERVGGIRIAITSPWRLLVAALPLGVARPLLAPAAPIYKDLPARMRASWRTAPSRAAWSAIAGTRFAILFVGYLAVVMFGYNNGRPPLRVSTNEV